jgi:hypothetical protein
MALKTAYNIQLRNPRTFPSELQCIDAVINALQSNYPCVKAKKVHGKKVQFNTGNGRIAREICDIFLVLRYKDYYRFSFIQNKRETKKYQVGLGNFKINAGQHCFLVKKPYFSYNQQNYSLLRKAKYDTVTAYSVFYREANGDYNFDFASAISCKCAKQNAFCCCNFTEKCNTTHCYQQIKFLHNNPKIDYIALANADEIEANPHFGEVIDLEDLRMKEFRMLISDCAGKDMLDFLDLNDIGLNYIPESDTASPSTQLIIKNFVAIDLRKMKNRT